MYNTIESILERKISTAHVRQILGESIYNGISNYVFEFNSEANISPAEILIEGLGSNIIYNKNFQNILLLEVLNEQYIIELCELMNVKFLTNFTSREELLNKSYNNLGDNFLSLL